MPSIVGINHLSLSVSDLDASVQWYEKVLGFTVVSRKLPGGLDKALLRPADSGVTVVLVSHAEAAEPGAFNERRAGLDHLSFAVADRAALDEWGARLDELGIARSEVKTGSTGELIAFRDPDNIALEFYTLPR